MFNMEELELAFEAKAQALELPTCEFEGCDNPTASRKATVCVMHRVSDRKVRYADYANLVRDAATVANSTQGDITGSRVFVRIDKGTAGFTYYLKEAVSGQVVPATSKKNPDGHSYGGTLLKLKKGDTVEAAIAFASVINQSTIAKTEGFHAEVVVAV